jgi:Uma2 family endonuclease
MALPKTKLEKLDVNWTVEEYLAFERTSETKHEYVDGEIYALAGGSKNHNRLASDLSSLLSQRVAGSACEAFIGDVLLQVRSTLFYYPDVYVVCNSAEDADEYIAHNPTLVAEVLAPSTKRIDRREKLAEYKRLPGLRECLLIHQDRVGVEIYSRATDTAEWEQRIYTNLQDELSFASISVTVKVEEIYRRVPFTALQEEGNDN